MIILLTAHQTCPHLLLTKDSDIPVPCILHKKRITAECVFSFLNLPQKHLHEVPFRITFALVILASIYNSPSLNGET